MKTMKKNEENIDNIWTDSGCQKGEEGMRKGRGRGGGEHENPTSGWSNSPGEIDGVKLMDCR